MESDCGRHMEEHILHQERKFIKASFVAAMSGGFSTLHVTATRKETLGGHWPPTDGIPVLKLSLRTKYS